MSRAAAIDYLRPPRGAPWRWEDNGRVLTWSDGTTLAFEPEIVAILERLEPAGLPWFATIVLTLAACRGKMPNVIEQATREVQTTGRADLLTVLSVRGVKEALGELHRLAQLPPKLTESAANKSVLVEAILDQAPRLSAAETAPIMRGLREGLTEIELNALTGTRPLLNVGKALQLVGDGVKRHTTESLLLRLGAGLDALPEEPGLELDLPRDERARRLLHALQDDAELGGLVAVVRDLMAALRLPRVMALVDENAAGGVSDIGNRGSPDRLLLSELAHDDLTLAARVALNEALYLRREPPAHQPQRTLAVLLDSGVRMWGVPRVLGAAAALALVSRHPNHDEALAWRAEGNRLKKVDLLSKRGLETHLSALVPDAHPGAALPAWRDELAKGDGEIDAVIVTHRDGFADEAFQARVAGLAFDRAFALVVDRDGTVELHALPWGAPRPLAQAQIDIQKLFPRSKDARPPAPLITTGDADDFPAIFRVQPFPLRLPVDSKMQLAHLIGEGGACLTMDKRLLYWERPDTGAQQLAADLPSGQAIWLRSDDRGRLIAVKHHSTQHHTHVMVSEVTVSGVATIRIASSARPHDCYMDGEILLLFYERRVVAVSLVQNEVVHDAALPVPCKHINSRYFWMDQHLTFASWDGAQVTWSEVHLAEKVTFQDVITAFDCQSVGPWILLRNGRLTTPTGASVPLVEPPVSRASVVEDGNRLLVFSGRVSEWKHFVADAEGVWRLAAIPGGSNWSVPPYIKPPTRRLRKEFSEIGISAEAGMRMLKRQGNPLDLVRVPVDGFVWRESANASTAKVASFRTIKPISTPKNFGCSLRVAEWPDGSRVWLDSRGLLHLRSSDRQIPEATLVLSTDVTLTGWCSNAAVCGDGFFLGPKTDRSTPRVERAVDAFCRRLC